MIKKILIANRGEIACRVIKTARRMGIATVAVYSDADAHALHVKMADEAVHIGPPPAAESYIVIDKILAAIRASPALEAVHPGYGFLSAKTRRSPRRLRPRASPFIGPPAGAIEAMGDKITSKKIASEAGVSTVPGYMGLISDADEAVKISGEIGYPVMIKASAGGGGKGMRIAWTDQEAREGFQSSKNEAASSFGDDRIFIEKFVTQPRHIEIQVLVRQPMATRIYLGERECSIQRRNQKVVEEAPSPFLGRRRARRWANRPSPGPSRGLHQRGHGGVHRRRRAEFLLPRNEHAPAGRAPVTELVTGVDLVEQMIRVAAGEPLAMTQADVRLTGWAMESRLYAEDPYRNFLPSIGRLTRYRPPAETPDYTPGVQPTAPVVRNDTGVYEGGEISMYYDPMIAKLCTWGPDRATAIEEMRVALDRFEVEGIGHNLPFLSAVYDHPKFKAGDITTAFIAEEYPEGFHGVDLPEPELRRVAAMAVAMHRLAEIRRTRISGTIDNHERRVGDDWVVSLAGLSLPVRIAADPEGADVHFDDGETLRVTSDWRPGAALAEAIVDARPLVMKVGKASGGYRLRTRGADIRVRVQSPRQAELAALMPKKLPPDTSKLLLCPMPGLVVKVDVEVGQEVQEGQALCTIEAMKMENILRAERKSVVTKINAGAGDSLAVDDVIMEFE